MLGSTATPLPLVRSEPAASSLDYALTREMADLVDQHIRESGNLAFFLSCHTLVVLKHYSAIRAAQLLQFAMSQQQQKTCNKTQDATLGFNEETDKRLSNANSMQLGIRLATGKQFVTYHNGPPEFVLSCRKARNGRACNTSISLPVSKPRHKGFRCTVKNRQSTCVTPT